MPIVQTILSSAGVKPAENEVHERLRTFLFVTLIFLIVWVIYDEVNEDYEELEAIEAIAKPGTMLHKTIDDMDPEMQKKYIKFMTTVILKDEPSLMHRYLDSIRNALIAGILSEYIINGNTSKPVGIIAKTVLYNIIFMTCSN